MSDEMNNLVKLAVDSYRGRVEKYSVSQAQDVLRQALIEANNGKTTLDYRAIRDGKCNGLFALIEELLNVTVEEGLTGSEFFFNMVEYRNVAEGDAPVFRVEDDNVLFEVAEAADGTQAIRRQRLGGATEMTLKTSLKVVRIYEELNRVLAGRVDFNTMVSKVAESFRQKLMDDIYSIWVNATADQFGGTTYFPVAGAYDEDALLELIAHVEAASGGQQATILGTKKALRNLKESINSDAYKDDLHNQGFAGLFFGTPVIAIPQRHKVGSTDFVMDDSVITIIAGSDKPIKVVREGSPLMIMRDPTLNFDLTQEYFYAEKWGVGILLAGGNSGIGRYEFSD